MKNLSDLTKAISAAVLENSPNANLDPALIEIEIEGVELSLYRVEYLPEENRIVIYLD